MFDKAGYREYTKTEKWWVRKSIPYLKVTVNKGGYMKKISVMVVVMTLIFAASAFAGGKAHDKKSGWDLEGKFYKMSGVIVKNAAELGITQEQQDAIKQKKYDLKKAMVRNKAEIDLVCIDISKELWKDQTDVNALSALVDKKYQLKAEKAKAAINAYGELNNSLSTEQKESIKVLCAEKRQGCAMSCRCAGMQAAGKRR